MPLARAECAGQAEAARARQAEHWERAKAHGDAAKESFSTEATRLQNLAEASTTTPTTQAGGGGGGGRESDVPEKRVQERRRSTTQAQQSGAPAQQ